MVRAMGVTPNPEWKLSKYIHNRSTRMNLQASAADWAHETVGMEKSGWEFGICANAYAHRQYYEFSSPEDRKKHLAECTKN